MAHAPRVLEVADLYIDVEHSLVMRNSQPVSLRQPLLFDLLLYLVLHRGKVVTRDQLLKHVWGYEQEYESRTVDVHMRWLRKSLEEDPAHPQLIQTIRGVGYCFQAE
jgi:DNA-binding response OmpR family regulator